MGRRRADGLPKGVRVQRYTQKGSGKKVAYAYYGRGPGSVALGQVGSPQFYAKLAAAMDRAPPADTVRSLIYQYQTSLEFQRLRDRTQSDYRKMLSKIADEFGELSLAAMGSRSAAQYIYRWRDSMASGPRRADYAVQVLKVLLSWGLKRGLLEVNPAAGVERLHRGDRSECAWTDEQVAAFLGVAPEPLRRAMMLALETGQRQGDLLVLPWSAIREGVLSFRQSKTEKPVSVEISPALETALAEAPKNDSTTILTRSDGKPWDPKGNGFRAAWRKACAKAGVEGVTFHDLRGTFVTRKLAEGWTPADVAGCTGHSLRNLGMLDAYAHRARIAQAAAERRRLARNI